MDAGVVQQFGTPDEVFDDPANLFVACSAANRRSTLPVARVADGRAPRSKWLRSELDTAVMESPMQSRATVGIRPQDCGAATDTRRVGGIRSSRWPTSEHL